MKSKMNGNSLANLRNSKAPKTTLKSSPGASTSTASASSPVCAGACEIHCACTARGASESLIKDSLLATRAELSKLQGSVEVLKAAHRVKVAEANATIDSLNAANEALNVKLRNAQKTKALLASKTLKEETNQPSDEEHDGSATSKNKEDASPRSLRRWAAELASVTGESSVTVLVKTLSRPEFRETLMEVVKNTGLEATIAKQIVSTIEDYWTVERGLGIRQRLKLGKRKYQYLLYLLRSDYDPATDVYISAEVVEGVPFPSMSKHASRNATDNKRKEYTNLLDPIESDDKKCISLALPKYLGAVLQHKEFEGQKITSNKTTSTEVKVGVQVTMDGAALDARGKIGQVTFGFKASTWRGKSLGHEGSCKSCHTCVIFEGEEKYEQMVEPTERLVSDIVSINKAGGIQLDAADDNTFVNTTFLAGGDMKIISEMCCHCGQSSLFPCPWCNISKSDLWDPDCVAVLRTLANTAEWAHLPHEGMSFPWKCECCGKTFDTKEELEAETLTSDAQKTKHAQTHFSIRHHRKVLLPIEMLLFIMDILHMNLRITEHLFKKTIACHVVTDAEEKALNAMLAELTGCFVRVKKETTKLEVKVTEQASFIGREALLLLGCYAEALELVLPREVFEEVHGETLKAWQSYIAVWKELCAEMEEDTTENREAKAKRVRALGVTFLAAYVEVAGKDAATVYMHSIPAHLPQWILTVGHLRKWGADCQE